tara:strand:- start:819 stop:2447 length:1629 start_codon:yes stop_codon:yes gene_type:complete
MIKKQVKNYVLNALDKLNIKYNNVIIQEPRNHENVDYATNIAMMLVKELNDSPFNIANEIVQELNKSQNDFFKEITIAKPGFINFTINESQYSKIISSILINGNLYGKSCIGKDKKALVEFVSANPTGPLTIGHGRGAIIGEFASKILEWNGYEVQREYYFNNAGRQMRKLAQSVEARYNEILGKEFSFPKDGYEGNYIYDIANKIITLHGNKLINDIDSIKKHAEQIIFDDIKATLKKLKIVFNNFFNEKDLYENNNIYKIIERLKNNGLIYEMDGATWFKATDLGLSQDRVLIKSTGEPTYRLPDMAYHKNKFDRKFDVIIDVFGADHMDAYPDVISVCKNIGYDTNKIKVLIHQFVTLEENGNPIKMSTRKANFISLDKLIDTVGADVVKYFFSMRGMNSHLNFDMSLAKDESDQNPVFYIQYAYARAINILNRAKDGNYYKINAFKHSLLKNKEEIQIIKKLINFQEIIEKSIEKFEPQLVATYLLDLSSIFHHYYSKHKVITDDRELTIARTILIDSVRQVLYNGLNILGLKTPNKM